MWIVDASLVRLPENVAVDLTSGGTVLLRCATNSTAGRILWSYNDSKSNYIYNGYKSDIERYSVFETAQGQFELRISPVRQSDAGQYYCIEAGSLLEASAQLVVFGKLTSFLLKYLVTFDVNLPAVYSFGFI